MLTAGQSQQNSSSQSGRPAVKKSTTSQSGIAYSTNEIIGTWQDQQVGGKIE